MKRSISTLLRFLTDRRPKLKAALETVNIAPDQSHSLPFLSEVSTEDLFALPNAPLSALTPDQLLRFAQIIDTALFKSYIIASPSLLGSLCRLPNWCEVSEVEQELHAREVCGHLGSSLPIADTIHTEVCRAHLPLQWKEDAFQGIRVIATVCDVTFVKLHSSHLVFRRLSEKDDDNESKLRPTISYLQRLGPEHLAQIFETSKWLLSQDREIGFEVSCALSYLIYPPLILQFRSLLLKMSNYPAPQLPIFCMASTLRYVPNTSNT